MSRDKHHSELEQGVGPNIAVWGFMGWETKGVYGAKYEIIS